MNTDRPLWDLVNDLYHTIADDPARTASYLAITGSYIITNELMPLANKAMNKMSLRARMAVKVAAGAVVMAVPLGYKLFNPEVTTENPVYSSGMMSSAAGTSIALFKSAIKDSINYRKQAELEKIVD